MNLEPADLPPSDSIIFLNWFRADSAHTGAAQSAEQIS